MKFNNSNIKFAKERGIDLNIEKEQGFVMFFVSGGEEPFLVYLMNEEGTILTFKGQVYGEKIEDLPAHITSSKQLNAVTNYLSSFIEELK